MIDSNVWIDYCDEGAKYHSKIKEFIDHQMSLNEIMITQKIKIETPIIIKKILLQYKKMLDKNQYDVEQESYCDRMSERKKKVNDIFRKIHYAKKLSGSAPAYNDVKDLYDDIYEDVDGIYRAKKERVIKIKYLPKHSEDSWDKMSASERETMIDTYDPGKNDIDILAATLHEKNLDSKYGVILLTRDTDFRVFACDIRKKFHISIVSSNDISLLNKKK